MVMPKPSHRPRRASAGAVAVLSVAACSLAAVLLEPRVAFIAAGATEGAVRPADGLAEGRLPVSPRSRIIGTFGLLAGTPYLLSGGIQPVVADGGKVPDALEVTGRVGTRADINGRWSIVFGKKLNDRAVYRKDGGSKDGSPYYLMINNCKQFQMDTKIDGECKGFAVKADDGWKIDGSIDPEVKLKPYELPKDDIYQEEGFFR